MKTITVWYMRPEWFRNGIVGDKPDAANLSATHILLRSTEQEAVDLDAVYRAMQGEICSPNGEACNLIVSKGLAHTSMSVGDVIVVDGEAHVLASFGFDKLGRTPQ